MADTMGGLAFQPIVPFQHLPRFRHEGPVLPEVGEGPSPRLQGGPPSWQGLRDLQVQPPFQGAPALKPGHGPAPSAGSREPRHGKGRSDAAFPRFRTLTIGRTPDEDPGMKPILLAAALAAAAVAGTAAAADTLLIERVQQENRAALPARGMTMAQVEARY